MEHDTSFWLAAIGYMLIGWAVRVALYYFKFDTDKKFNFKKWWRIYDKCIILGFVGSVAFAFIADLVWVYGLDGVLGMDGVPYEVRFNIIIGLLIIPILNRWEKKSNGG